MQTSDRRTSSVPTLDRDGAVAAARALASGPGRRVLGLAGPPAAGKSTLAALLAQAVPGAVVVGMDGWHLAHSVLVARGDVADKGAPGTFDAEGYVALLERLRAEPAREVWAPEFRREVEDAIAGAVRVPPDCPLVVTEGNYLLLPEPPWTRARALCDQVWWVEADDDVRLARLVARHVAHGREPLAARERATVGVDGANARLVAPGRDLADARVVVP